MINNFEMFEKNIGYNFKNKTLLEKALTHTSYAYENKVESYERLEYLGDSILEFISSKYLFLNYNNLSEGEMTKVRASAVCEESLYKIANKREIIKIQDEFYKLYESGDCPCYGNPARRRGPSGAVDR